MIKKIFSVVSDNDFYKFRARATREGKTMGDVLTALASNYANGRDKEPAKVSAPKSSITTNVTTQR